MAQENCKQTVNAGQYATVADFKRIFTEDVNSLYLLSLLPTGNPENAEQRFVEGIGAIVIPEKESFFTLRQSLRLPAPRQVKPLAAIPNPLPCAQLRTPSTE